MNVKSLTCASPDYDTHWHSIDWARCHQTVKKLQSRIVKATQEGKPGKVKALQWILTHSFSGKALSVKRVTENKGKNTPGVDQETWSTPAAKSQAILSLKRRGYSPQPLRRIYIPKNNDKNKKRPLSIPVMKDRGMQALYLLALEPIAEVKADKNSYGFRPKRCTADAIAQCFIALSRNFSAQFILKCDIKSCFDKISHQWLIEQIPTDKTILHKWLKAGFMDKEILHPTESGVCQGGIISPCIANMVLDGLENLLSRKDADNKRNKHKIHLVRWADDFIITGNSREILDQEVKPLVSKFLGERGLELSPEKTKIVHIDEGFDFLGQNIRKYKGKLFIKPSKENIKSFLNKVRGIIKSNKACTTVNLIGLLNPVIIGWANYHRHTVASETFNDVDSEIWRSLWRWAKRRHPKKGQIWIKNNYFKNVGTRNWVFSAKTGLFQRDGNPKWITLRKARDIPIKRYVKIKAEANPFDPAWEHYFEERLNLKMRDNLQMKKRLLILWSEQAGKCPCCKQSIEEEERWHVHHILPRCKGGKDTLDNLVLVHPNCHRQIHSQNLTVVKPASVRKL